MFSFLIFLGHRVTRSVWEGKLLGLHASVPRSRLFSSRQRFWSQSWAHLVMKKKRFLYAKDTQENYHCRCSPKRKTMGQLGVGNLKHSSSPPEFCGSDRASCTFYTLGICQEDGNRNNKEKIDTDDVRNNEGMNPEPSEMWNEKE